jgi:hypothetical protein
MACVGPTSTVQVLWPSTGKATDDHLALLEYSPRIRLAQPQNVTSLATIG